MRSGLGRFAAPNGGSPVKRRDGQRAGRSAAPATADRRDAALCPVFQPQPADGRQAKGAHERSAAFPLLTAGGR
ncbi:hypothetical protein GCM10010286_26120 [Streptomyces toxytricini]|nr:hypothetical protein GCM10010286_26120 [Streptomyces toxytricini]